MLVVCLCHIILAYFFIMAYPYQSYAYCLMYNVMINAKYNTFAIAILWENINNNTLTLQVKCYNDISVRLRIPSVIV